MEGARGEAEVLFPLELPEIILTASIVVLLVAMCAFYSKSRRRITRFLFGALSGAAVLIPAQLALSAAGVPFAVNLFTGTVSVVMGVPGVILLIAAALL